MSAMIAPAKMHLGRRSFSDYQALADAEPSGHPSQAGMSTGEWQKNLPQGPHLLTDDDLERLPKPYRGHARIENGALVFAALQKSKLPGNWRVSYSYNPPLEVTLLAAQHGESLGAWVGPLGTRIFAAEFGKAVPDPLSRSYFGPVILEFRQWQFDPLSIGAFVLWGAAILAVVMLAMQEQTQSPGALLLCSPVVPLVGSLSTLAITALDCRVNGLAAVLAASAAGAAAGRD